MTSPYSPDPSNPYSKGPDPENSPYPPAYSDTPQYPSGNSGGFGGPAGGRGGWGGQGGAPKPDNYLVWAILSTVLCCLPAGIVAIVFATKVDSAWAMGDVAGARAASESAKKWSIISAIAAVAVSAAYFIFIIVASGLAST